MNTFRLKLHRKINIRGGWTLLGIIVLLVQSVLGQPSVNTPLTNDTFGPGLPLIENYLRKDYGGHSQNWWAAQRDNGLMYFGNTDGMVEFDGIRWRKITLPGRRIVRSIAIDKTDKVFVTADNEFGYFEPTKWKYNSLLSQLPDEYSDFGFVGKCWAAAEGVYFVSSRYVFLYDGIEFKVWKTKTSFLRSFYLDNKLYVLQRDLGITSLTNGEFSLIEGADIFNKERTFSLVKTRSNGLIIGNRSGGFFKYNGKTLEPFFQLPSNYRLALSNQSMVALTDGRYVLATLEGLLIFDSEGNFSQLINKPLGLADNFVIE